LFLEDSENIIEYPIKLPRDLKAQLDHRNIDIQQVSLGALEQIIQSQIILPKYTELSFSIDEGSKSLQASDIPPGHYIRLPHLTTEQYEAIIDEGSWEYLDGYLIHYSPESNYHNIILNSLVLRAGATLEKGKYTFRTSRVALSIGEDKPEPDFMILEKASISQKTRKDGSVSEIIDSIPLLIIEIVSESSFDVDSRKSIKYLQKRVPEFWRIYISQTPLVIEQSFLDGEQYRSKKFIEGWVQSRMIPEFSVDMATILYPEW
jgi:Uma2 family endonuclease